MRSRWFTVMLGMVTCALLVGCGTEPADVARNQAPAHDHSAEGLHGGHVIELGEEEYHAELTHDHATHTVAIYLLDSTGKKPVSSEQESITLKVFKDGDYVDHTLNKSAGDDGTFSTDDEQLCDLLDGEDIRGRLHVTIAGKEFVGVIDHEAHDEDHATD